MEDELKRQANERVEKERQKRIVHTQEMALKRIGKRGLANEPESCLPCCMGCAAAPWTGSLLCKQSAIIAATSGSAAGAPPLA